MKLTLQEVYAMLFNSEKHRMAEYIREGEKFMTLDKINRICNIYAVKNTAKVWREQWKN